MATSTLKVSEINQNFSRAKKAVKNGPVIITEHGKPSLVLMTYEDYAARTENEVPREETVLDLFRRLHVPGLEDIDLELPPRRISKRSADIF